MSIVVPGAPYTPAPIPTFKYSLQAWSNGTPFTYQDHRTYTSLLEQLIAQIDSVASHADNNGNALYAGFKSTLDDLLTQMNSAINDKDAWVTGELNTLANAVNAAVSEVINSTIAVTEPVISSVLDTSNVQVKSSRFSVDPSGVGSSNAGILASLIAAPRGAEIQLVGDMRFTGTITITPEIWAKNLTVDYSRASHIRDHGGYSWMVNAPLEAAYTPTGIIAALTENVSQDQTHTVDVLTFPADNIPPWKENDILRIVGDDILPGENYNASDIGTNKHMRPGETIKVFKVIGNSVYLTRRLLETYTQNIRVARMMPGGFHFKNIRADVSAAVWADKTDGGFCRFYGGRRNLGMENAIFERDTSYPVSLRGVRGGSFSRIGGGILNNDPKASRYGYLFHAAGSQDCVLEFVDYDDGRHSFTDGSNLIEANHPNLWNYGRTQNIKVVNANVTATSQSGLDTHHVSRNIQFINATIYGAKGGTKNAVAFRGESHSAVGVVSYDCETVLSIFNEDYSGESNKHYVANVRAYGAKQLLAVNVHHLPNHVNYGKRDTELNVIINGVYGDNIESLGFIRNGKVKFVGPVRLKAGKTLATAPIWLENAELEAYDYEYDGSAIESITASQFYYATKESVIKLKGKTILSDAAIASLPNARTFFSADSTATVNGQQVTTIGTHTFEVDMTYNKWFSDRPHVVPISARFVDNRFRYDLDTTMDDTAYIQAMVNSETLFVSGANIESESFIARLGQSKADNLFIVLTNSDATNRNLAKLFRPSGNGKTLSIWARSITSTGVVSVTSDTTNKRLSLNGPASANLATGQWLIFRAYQNYWVKSN